MFGGLFLGAQIDWADGVALAFQIVERWASTPLASEGIATASSASFRASSSGSIRAVSRI